MRILKTVSKIFHRCQHLHVRETMACEAICLECGRNLGFIQNWRETNKGNTDAPEISNDPDDPRLWRRHGT